MEVVEPNYSVIHHELSGAEDYKPEQILERVGGYMDQRINEMLEDPEAVVTGYLDAVFEDIGEPRFDPMMTYEPDGFIDRVEVDDINGVFYVHGNGDINRYWMPYMENNTLCIFTDHFSKTDPLEGQRFLFEGDVKEIPETPANSQITHDIARIYEAVEREVGEEWGIPHLGQNVSSGDVEGFNVDTSPIQEDLLEIQEENPELFKQAMDKIERIADDPINQSEKIIAGERIYKINREYRLTGNITSQQENQVKLKRYGHRENVYSEEVDH